MMFPSHVPFKEYQFWQSLPKVKTTLRKENWKAISLRHQRGVMVAQSSSINEQLRVDPTWSGDTIVIFGKADDPQTHELSSFRVSWLCFQNRGTPKSSILVGFSLTKTIQLLGYPHGHGHPDRGKKGNTQPLSPLFPLSPPMAMDTSSATPPCLKGQGQIRAAIHTTTWWGPHWAWDSLSDRRHGRHEMYIACIC